MVDARNQDADYQDLMARLRTNADYDTPPVTSTTKAYLFIAACREYLVKFEEVEKGQRYRMRFNHTEIRHQLERAENWVAANAHLDDSNTPPSSGHVHVDLRSFRD